MLTIGLTGGIAVGKTTAAGFFAAAGLPVFDADACVHRLYQGEAAPVIGAAFPNAIADGAIDRRALAGLVSADATALTRLEALIHPLVRREELRFLQTAKGEGRDAVLLDIPLLLEGRPQLPIDVVVVVVASRHIQLARALARPGMTQATLDALTARQMDDAGRRSRAHFIVDGGQDRQRVQQAVLDILRAVAPLRHALTRSSG